MARDPFADIDEQIAALAAGVARAQQAQAAVDALTTPTIAWRLDDEGCWRIDGKDCWIWMQARPHYCDRGSWLAHVELLAHATRPGARELHLDAADGWPRYYFDLDRAKAEVEAWLRKRGQVI